MTTLAPPAGTLFVATLYRWGDIGHSVTVLFGGGRESFDELRTAVPAHADRLVTRDACRGDRYVLSLHCIHPAEGEPCHLGQEYAISVPMTERFFRGAICHELIDMIATLEQSVALHQAPAPAIALH